MLHKLIPSSPQGQLCLPEQCSNPARRTSGLKIMVCVLGHCWQIVICRPGGHFLGRKDLSANFQTAFGQIEFSIPSNMDLPLLLKPL